MVRTGNPSVATLDDIPRHVTYFEPPKLVRARTRRGLTHQQLAEIVGIAQPNYAAYETGRVVPRIEMIRRLADALGVQVVDLLRRPRKPTFIWLREQAGLTQSEVARILGINVSTWHRIEKGKVGLDGHLDLLADTLGTDADTLVDAWARAGRRRR